jgi:hypothetical protein
MASNESEPTAEQIESAASKSTKAKPIKVLPTERVGFDKQLAILRGYAAASGVEKKPVSNSDVGSIVGIHVGSVSNCNPFFADVGLLVRESGVYRPAEAVFEYAASFEWDSEGASTKLGGILGATWFGMALLPRLNFRSMSKDDAIKVLGEEAKASPEYRAQLELLLDYLSASGVVLLEGNTVSKRAQSGNRHSPIETPAQPAAPTEPAPPKSESQSLHPFVQGLLKTLPQPDSDWPMSKRAKWLQAASNIFDLIYSTTESDTTIRITVDQN